MKVILRCVLFLLAQHAFAQWNSPQLVGVYFDRPDGENRFTLTRIDTATCQFLPIGVFEETYSAVNEGQSYAIDNKNMRFFCNWSIDPFPQHLYTISLITGELIYSTDVYPPQSMMGWWSSNLLYNMETDELLGLFDDVTTSRNYLVRMNPSNGILDTIMFLDFKYFAFVSQGIDYKNHRIFLVGHNESQTEIWVIDYHNWTKSKFFINGGGTPQRKVFNCNTGMLYDIEDYDLVEINVFDRTKKIIAENISDVDYPDCLALDPFGEKIYIGNYPNEVSEYDFNSGSLFHKYVSNPDTFPFSFNSTFIMYLPDSVKASFSSKMCSNNAIHFFGLTEETYNWYWDFGDQTSADNNFSTEQNPIHYFSDTGFFKITLTSATCFAADTFSEWIHVTTTPPISLGNDTVICTDYNYGPIVLKVPLDSTYQITWQDGSHNSSFNVISPGVYSVLVSDACTIQRDTIKVNGIECGCEVKPISDLISGSMSIYIECGISNFPDLKLNVFNAIGQTVFEKKIDDTNQTIFLGKLSSGIYFYRLINGDQILSVDKVVIQR